MNYKSTEVINILGWYSDTRNIVSAMDGDSMQGLLLVSKRKKKGGWKVEVLDTRSMYGKYWSDISTTCSRPRSLRVRVINR